MRMDKRIRIRTLGIVWVIIWGIVFLLCAWCIAHASGGERQPNFFDTPDICKGWHCYEDPKEHEVEVPQPLITTGEQPLSPPEFTGEVDWEALWTMPPQKMKDLINQAMSWAQEDLDDKKRMEVYLKLQGVAMRRAKKFQEAWDEMVLTNPVLDATVSRSPTHLGSLLEVVTERKDRAVVLDEMSHNMGLLYFYSPECAYCKKEQEILSGFIEKWSWKNVTAINIVANPEAAENYDVQVVPDLWIVGSTDEGIQQRRLKAGLASHGDIESGLLMAWNLWFKNNRYERPTMAEEIVTFDDFLKRNP